MEYVIVSKEWMTQRGYVIQPEMRVNVDGSKVILHKPFIAPHLQDEGIETYSHDSQAFMDLLASAEWTYEVEEPISTSADGTKEKPYAYDGIVDLVKGSYYTQDGVLYVCTRSLYEQSDAPLKDLVGMYVKESA